MQTSSARPDTSLLFSLRELRVLEDERREREASELRAAEAARQAQIAEASERAAAAIAAAERAERDEQLRIAQAREAAERSARVAVEQAEAAARAQHQAELDHARLVQEMELRRAEVARKRPTWMLVVTALAAAAAAGLVWFAVQRQHESDDSRAQTAIAQRERAEAIAMAQDSRKQLDLLDGQLSGLDAKVKQALEDSIRDTTAAQKAESARRIAQLAREQADLRTRVAAAKAAEELRIRRGGIRITAECANASLSKNCP